MQRKGIVKGTAAQRRLNEARERERGVVDLWRERPAAQRRPEDVLAFYGWLAEHQPKLVPAGPGAIERVRRLVERDIVHVETSGTRTAPATEPGACWVITNREGDVVAASEQSARLLGVKPSGLLERNLLLFFGSARDEWRTRAATATMADSERFEASLRPRETRPIAVVVTLTALGSSRDAHVRWTLDARMRRDPEPKGGQ
jgi:PAS domain-containing protein